MKWSITGNKEWDHLTTAFDWVAEMQGVPQDAIHHAEGDVATHTRMVLDVLESSEEFKMLNEGDRELIWAAALLHDVEKRSTTVKETDGRVSSRGHARKGEFTTRRILYQDIPTPFAVREHIATLVRYHGLPLWIMDKRDPVKAVLEASHHVDMALLTLLAKSDALGRICGDQRDLLDRIDFFKAFCEEQQCWHTPRNFPSGLSRFVYFQKDESSPEYVPYDDLKGEVILLSGLPGMGKDTFLKKNYPDLPVISLDDIRRKYRLKPDDPSATGWVVQQAKEQAKVYLRKGQPFAWNATNITRQLRTQWIDLFVSYKARVKVVYIETTYREWLRQNNDREHPVPQEILFRLLGKLEIPAPYEAHDVQYVV